LNKAALTVAWLVAIDFLSCKRNVICSWEKSDFEDVLEKFSVFYRYCKALNQVFNLMYVNTLAKKEISMV